ncbi:histidine phosphatase family protein [Zhongshania sp. BJYM1]|uniref:histidine phosphatase family protein n=1 Tax=Zhongshania aquatica TaxID=2965069 RepID=UPI0022B2C7D3|nr:histidine phosphatase family protein [Marortus sp. BJYM1]
MTQGKIHFVRHAQTYANIDKVWHGHTDTELTPEGYEQTRKLGAYFSNYLRPDVIYTSPLQRARITAEAIAKPFDLSVIHDPRLMELDLGDWEGVTFQSLSKEDTNAMAELVNNPDYCSPNGESQNVVKLRMLAAISEISAKHPNENIVIVSHGVAISIALAHYLDDDTTQWPKYSKSNTAFSELCLSSKQLLRFNQSDHLIAD